MPDEWITIVAPGEPNHALAAFEEWKLRHPESRRGLAPDDIRIDVIRAADGRTLQRHRVRARNPSEGPASTD